jgi:hypothetical protein
MMWRSALASSLLLGQVIAGTIGNAGLVVRRGDTTEQSMRRYVDDIVESKGGLRRRQAAAINVTEWDAQTEAACTTALSALNGNASNPSGVAACYNLPSLNYTTGVFEADLRLFVISAPVDDFSDIPAQDVTVDIAYSGASVSPVNSSSLRKRSETSLFSWPRGLDGRLKRAAVPVMMQSYNFVGQINADLMATDMDM